jgi:hypothetical protein
VLKQPFGADPRICLLICLATPWAARKRGTAQGLIRARQSLRSFATCSDGLSAVLPVQSNHVDRSHSGRTLPAQTSWRGRCIRASCPSPVSKSVRLVLRHPRSSSATAIVRASFGRTCFCVSKPKRVLIRRGTDSISDKIPSRRNIRTRTPNELAKTCGISMPQSSEMTRLTAMKASMPILHL